MVYLALLGIDYASIDIASDHKKSDAKKPLHCQISYMYVSNLQSTTYDHRLWNIGHPVRSAIHKPQIGGLVVGSVTTSEYPLLYVLLFDLPFNVSPMHPETRLNEVKEHS